MTRSPTSRLLALWTALSPWPGGRWLFSRLLGRMVPYSGALRATVVDFGPGRAEARLRERRGVRNHLRSVHAIALANLGELATGLAVLASLPPDARGIVTALRVEYRKKARGTLTCRCETSLPDLPDEALPHEVGAEIVDEAGDVVATVTATWRLARAPSPTGRSA